MSIYKYSSSKLYMVGELLGVSVNVFVVGLNVGIVLDDEVGEFVGRIVGLVVGISVDGFVVGNLVEIGELDGEYVEGLKVGDELEVVGKIVGEKEGLKVFFFRVIKLILFLNNSFFIILI